MLNQIERLDVKSKALTNLPCYKNLMLPVMLLLSLSSCIAPLIVGGGAAVGALATRDKGIGGAISDSSISTRVKAKLYKFSPDLYAKTSVNVQSGEVLLAGMVKDPMWPIEAEKLCWNTDGVKSVNNQIEVTDDSDLSTAPKDSWITTQVKSKILFKSDVQSLNYSVKTVNGVVYLMGVAQNKKELDEVIEAARNTSSVKKVICLVRMKGECAS